MSRSSGAGSATFHTGTGTCDGETRAWDMGTV